MNAVEEVATPALGLRGLLVLLIVFQELLLPVRISLEEEATDPVEGAAQPMEQFAHAARGEPSTEGRLDPVAYLAGRPEAAGGDLVFEAVELARRESARVALVLQGAEGLQPAALVELPPVANGAGTDAEECGDLCRGAPLA
jgi:hypothetical protein